MPKFTTEREREIRGLLSKLERSGRSVREFAQEHGVSAWTVYMWRRRFGRRLHGPRADLVEVRTSDVRCPAIELAIGDASIRVPSGFDEDELRRVLSVVRSC